MRNSLLVALAGVIHLATAFPSIKIPLARKPILATSFCVYPDEFVVRNFQVWTPNADNSHSSVINFDYSDDTTQVQTTCHYNGSSVNVAPAGAPARYACDLRWVHFNWKDGKLTVNEKTCPSEEHDYKMESTGSVTPNLTCYSSSQDSSFGAGTGCASTPKVLAAVFTSTGKEPS